VTRGLYVGIDLGTTNSAVAVFDGERLELVRNPQGATLTASVVRIDPRGNVTVGARARRSLDQDPDNVRAEFKRLMGTAHTLSFPASGLHKRPEELAAEILRSLREDVRAQTGVLPSCAVISVPALFELPQTAATSEAARLAGFERVELIQEPVASAIAAGWRAEDDRRPWLVYDLGGGTFDVSLLETQDGMLRVVGHDGDNFLGGRDFDAAIVDWVIERIASGGGPAIARSDPGNAIALRRLRAAAEEAKIELTRGREAEISVLRLEAGGRTLDVAQLLDRGTLERLVEPLVARSLTVCARLLARHGIVLEAGALSRVVLIGGPTAMPLLQARVRDALAAPFGDGLDPMTLVAQGGALYAATTKLDGRAASSVTGQATNGAKLWLQYPAVSSDPNPFVVGKVVGTTDAAGGARLPSGEPARRERIANIVIRRDDGAWSSAREPVDAEGTFAVMVQLVPRRENTLTIEARSAADTPIAVTPTSLTIVHGVTLDDPPLARTVGVALAGGGVQVYFDRGTPLPMRRTFALHTAEALAPHDPEGALRVPIVQGEFPLARLCRLVGTIEIAARDLRTPLPMRAAIDVTIELDRGGRLTANARIRDTDQVFEGVAHLVAGTVPLEQLRPRLDELARRIQTVRTAAFQRHERTVLDRLAGADDVLARASREEEAARGGDLDAAEKVRRVLIDLDASLAEAEAEQAWPELEQRVIAALAYHTSWIAAHGTPEERSVLAGATAAIERARVARNAAEIDRQIEVIGRIGTAAYYRRPGAWEHELERLGGRLAETSDPPTALRLLEQGRAAVSRSDEAGIEAAVRALWKLLPVRVRDARETHGSGVR
jgi:molecular chaperone DnaK